VKISMDWNQKSEISFLERVRMPNTHQAGFFRTEAHDGNKSIPGHESCSVAMDMQRWKSLV
jgi:hypothetical protein